MSHSDRTQNPYPAPATAVSQRQEGGLTQALGMGPVCIKDAYKNGMIFFVVQTKVSWRTLFIIWYSRQRLGIKVQSCLVLR